MWLPKDERRLLAGLYRLIGEPATGKCYRNHSLGRLLRSPRSWKQVTQYGQPGDRHNGSVSMEDMDRFKREVRRVIDLDNRVARTCKVLKSRNLIRSNPHQTETDVAFVELTVEGFDLGRKYASFLDRSGLWFREYRDHWLWLLLGYSAGCVTPFILNLLGVRLR